MIRCVATYRKVVYVYSPSYSTPSCSNNPRSEQMFQANPLLPRNGDAGLIHPNGTLTNLGRLVCTTSGHFLAPISGGQRAKCTETPEGVIIAGRTELRKLFETFAAGSNLTEINITIPEWKKLGHEQIWSGRRETTADVW